MIAVDTNVLVYARRKELSLHALACEKLRRLAEGTEPWAIPVFCLGEFLRVVSHPRLFDPPTEIAAGIEFLQSLFMSPSVHLLLPGEHYFSLLVELTREAQLSGNLVFDAQIAAVCVEHGARELLTHDKDFLRFRQLRVIPLEVP